MQQLAIIPLRVHAALGEHLAAGDDERGASLVEYALLVALIALVCVAAVTLLGTSLEPQYSSVADGLK
jgi:pilus assembly protein Flp/PilA